MISCLMILFLVITPSALRTEKFNGVDLEEAQVEAECMKIRFEDAGVPDIPHMETTYFLRLKVENPGDQPCVFEPKRFRIVDADGKRLDALEVLIRQVRQVGGRNSGVGEDEADTLPPHASYEYAIVFGPVPLAQAQPEPVRYPARLYYKEALLGDLTK